MRIISGQHKGRTIEVHKKFTARPTTDYAKESIFNIIANHFDFEDLSVLDLFSGTGSISYEFASRGCKSVHAIEIEPRSAAFIKKNSDTLNMGIKIWKMDAFSFIARGKEKFDIIFADPPYDLDKLKNIPELILKSDLLQVGGWLILEHGKDNSFDNNPLIIDKRTYGSVHFSIFKKQ